MKTTTLVGLLGLSVLSACDAVKFPGKELPSIIPERTSLERNPVRAEEPLEQIFLCGRDNYTPSNLIYKGDLLNVALEESGVPFYQINHSSDYLGINVRTFEDARVLLDLLEPRSAKQVDFTITRTHYTPENTSGATFTQMREISDINFRVYCGDPRDLVTTVPNQ